MADREPLHVVPDFLLSACEAHADNNPDFQQVWLRFIRWRAHTVFNHSLVTSVVTRLDTLAAELRRVGDTLRADDLLQQPSNTLQSVDALGQAQAIQEREWGKDHGASSRHTR